MHFNSGGILVCCTSVAEVCGLVEYDAGSVDSPFLTFGRNVVHSYSGSCGEVLAA